MAKNSYSEELEQWLDARRLLRILAAFWLIPAVALMWVGSAGLGFHQLEPPSGANAFGSDVAVVQAMSIVLALLTGSIGISVALRSFPNGVRSFDLRPPVAQVLVSIGISVVMVNLAWLAPGSHSLLVACAVVAGYVAVVFLGRFLLNCPAVDTGPMVALLGAVGFQMTFGWLHVVSASLATSPVLMLEGAIIGFAALWAANSEPFAPLTPRLPKGSQGHEDRAKPALVVDDLSTLVSLEGAQKVGVGS